MLFAWGCGGGSGRSIDAPTVVEVAPIRDALVTIVDSPDAAGFVDAFPVEDAGEFPGDALDAMDTPQRDAPEPEDAPWLPDAVEGDLGADAVDDIALDARRDTKPDASPYVAPTRVGTVYTFAFADTRFAVDTAKGARITTLSLGGVNLLGVAKDASDNNWGSTFWPSPQSDWNWPPPAEVDGNAYSAAVGSGILTATSKTSSTLGLSVSKAFSADPALGVVTVEYTIVNRGSLAHSFAPWEITRVPADGVTFFPMGEGSPRKGSPAILPLVVRDGIAWASHADKTSTVDRKVFADGAEGWVAHASGSMLLVKSFPDITVDEAAPGEGEIELFADPANTYVEVENQGAYRQLAPGATLRYRVRWFARILPADATATAGDPALLAFVRSLVP